ncbi:MAG TPA: BatA domain-containing protein [Chiayiivirga sp.]|nr:BatA domain-containing protein [Chiayiivirga sp.]
MSLGLLLPLALTGLAAVLLPILLHLARSTALDRIDFAALRWLRAQRSPRRRPRIEHWLLLILRCALIATVVLFLAQPVLNGYHDLRPTVAVMPGVSAQAIAAQTLPEGARRVWLADGFPTLDSTPPRQPQASMSLLRQLDAERAPGAELIVLVTSQFDGTDAERPRLSRAIDWRIVAGEPAPRAVPKAPEAPRIALYVDAEHQSHSGFIQAVSQAWHARSDRLVSHAPTEALPTDTVLLVWLVNGPIPAAVLQWVEQGGDALLAQAAEWPSATAVPAWRSVDGPISMDAATLGQGRLWRFDQPLTPQAMPVLLEPTFPRALQRALAPTPMIAHRADARALAPLDGGAALPIPAVSLQPWLALLVALLFLAERVLAVRVRWSA